MTRSASNDGRIITESTSAYLPAVAASGGYPSGFRDALVTCDGRDECGLDHGPFDACDVWVSIPDAWSDVTFRLLGKTADAWAELAAGTMRAARGVDRASSMNLTGILFSHRGDPCDEYRLEGYNTDADHEEGSFTMRLWNCSSQRVVEPYADNANVLHATADLIDGTPTVLIPAPLNGGQLYISDISITQSDDKIHRVGLYSRIPPTGAPALVFSWWTFIVGPPWSFTKPVPLPPGAEAVIITDLPGPGPTPIITVNLVAYVG